MNNADFCKFYNFSEYRVQHERHTRVEAGTTFHYLGYMKGGKGLLIVGKERLEISAGDLFYLPKGCKYHAYWLGEDPISFDAFGFKFLPVPDRTYPPQIVVCGDEERELMRRLSADKTVSCASVGLLYTLFGMLEEKMAFVPAQHQGDLVERALEFIRANPEAQMADVAKVCGVSESTLYLTFRKKLNKTPNCVRREIQCERAVELLTTTDFSVETISERLGFSSASYFRKVFSEVVGESPRQVRAKSHFI